MCSYFTAIISMMINMFMFCYTGEQLTVQVFLCISFAKIISYDYDICNYTYNI